MNEKETSTSSNNKSAIINAVFIGFLIGIACYSIFKNGWGWVAIIPLFFAYKLANKPK